MRRLSRQAFLQRLQFDLHAFPGKVQSKAFLGGEGVIFLFEQGEFVVGSGGIMMREDDMLDRGLFGKGDYRLQPIYVDDLAKLAVEQGAGRENCVIDAVGPETFTYRNLVAEIGRIIGRKRPMVGIPPMLGFLVGSVVGKLVGDVVVTREEIKGLMADLLSVDSPPAGTTKLTDWATEHADSLGRRYASELARRRDRSTEY